MNLKCLVTGTAGFIGSHLAERLIAEGYEVIGVDCFTDYYPRPMKERNLAELRKSDRFHYGEVTR
jgi:nucleoside-diphosphate-sugar epimerase